MTKVFLETPKLLGALECLFCFTICSSGTQEDRRATSSWKPVRKDDKIPEGKGGEVGTSVGSGLQETETGQLSNGREPELSTGPQSHRGHGGLDDAEEAG